MSGSKAVVNAPQLSGDPSRYESEHVHQVYDSIASHFSATRYKPWPIVSNFISSLSPGSIGLDLGCGNGKYLGLPIEQPSRIRTIGVDRSFNLLEIATKVGPDGSEAVLGDVLDMPWRKNVYDYIISIATIHHLATEARRIQAIEAMLRLAVSKGGRILIYVWAIEQDNASKRVIPLVDTKPDLHSAPDSGEPQVPHDGVDVLVPWVHNTALAGNRNSQASKDEMPVYNRYYHMFAYGELRRIVIEAAKNLGLQVGSPEPNNKGLSIVQEGWERSNYYIELYLWQAD